MEYASIMVHLDTSPRALDRLEIAARLAVARHARLIGLFAGFMPDVAWFYLMEGAATYINEDRQRRSEAREAVHRRFLAATQDLGIETEWRAVDGDPLMMALREVREADLVVAGQYDPADPDSFVATQFLETLILDGGRPVLVIPFAGQFAAPGARVMVAWNGGREATRALHDAMPLICGGQAKVLCAQGTGARPDASLPGHAMAALASHGVQAELEHCQEGSDIAIGETLLSRAADFGADVVVMGAYGRGRLRELVLGGVTRALLDTMTVPVLMSH
ncbi:universal stress protein [Cupriavidus basilensis]|uniref:universal stress protein n=1 Tax=Cupriavidus basilensis TaxID=68895 RepID=UPI0020A642CB|nr:universal stress protein [Cupriavidus basilensis]MCP3023653.1 universal stress protein [Cupriavidus basilensis]